MSMTDTLKETIDSEITALEKKIESEKAKLEDSLAQHNAELAEDKLELEARKAIEGNIQKLKDQLGSAKARIKALGS